jgi:hypothetical protein
LLTTVIAAIVVAGGARYMISQATPVRADPLAAAVVQAPSSHSVALLEQQRQHIIAMSAATKSFKVVGTPKVAKVPVPVQAPAGAGTPVIAAPPPNPGTAQAIAYKLLPTFGFSASGQFNCLDQIFSRESGWRWNAANASGAYGIPQALPGSKMAQFGTDWQTNPATQIKWGIWYIKSRYGSPCNAWGFWQAHGWY